MGDASKPNMGSDSDVTELDTPDVTDRGTPDFGSQLFGIKKSQSGLSQATTVSESAEGCIVLGQDADRGNKYVTRFRIDHSQQRSQRVHNILQQTCCGCFSAANRSSAKSFLWAFVSSEALLLSLHLVAISLGAMKAGFNLRTVAADLHLAASTVETFVACLIIITRTAHGWIGFKALKAEHALVEYVASGSDIRTPRLRHTLNAHTVFGCLVLAADVTAFLLFYFLVHLDWTILSNNFCIIVITVVSAVLEKRLSSEIDFIKEDQHKAVIYETVLLLTECAWAKTSAEQKRVYAKIDRFCKALRDTDMFQKPDYISIPRDLYPNMSLVSQLELQSFV